MLVPRLKLEVIDSRTNPGIRFPRTLFQLTERLGNWKEFWVRVFLPRYLETVQQNFITEGELVGGWPDLNPTYAAWKARHFPGRKILELTRRLRRSLMPGVSGTSGAGSDTVLQVRPRELVIGTRVPYARWHADSRPFLLRVRVADYRKVIRDWMLEHDGRRP
jgi:hypothetical protein